MNRRRALHLLGGGAAAVFGPRAVWSASAPDEMFIFIHAAGGWDVTLWADPRNERKGLVEPASTSNTEIGGLDRWKSVTLDGDTDTFEILAPSDSTLRLGPAIGDLYDLRDRLTIINGLAMNTVSHADGIVYSATGRHLAGGHAPAPSIDVVIANELGTSQLLPGVSVQFPSSFVGENLDRRAIPLRIDNVAAIAKSLARGNAYLDDDDRKAITTLLTNEAQELSARSTHPETYQRIASQHASLPRLLGNELQQAFSAKTLQAKYPEFNYKAKEHSVGALSAAFAVEAMRRNLVRCVGFALGGLDTHFTNYRQHALTLQELFGTIATLVKLLDSTPHPSKPSNKLAEHTHILVFSDFCRTPQINLTGGRDHYPNNSALVISPRFRGGRSFGSTDIEQLLPANVSGFRNGPRQIGPPDLLATFLSAFNIDPRQYLRDGEVLGALLA